jgi:hypothetical protein
LFIAAALASTPAVDGTAVGSAVRVEGVPSVDGRLAALLTSAPVRVDHVFLLDTGGAMRARSEVLRESVARYVEAIPDGDGFALSVFHTRAMEVEPATVVDGSNRAAIAARIRAADFPSANASDLGAGLEALAHLVSRKGPDGRLAYVVSPYCHDPALGSEWDAGGRGCRAVRRPERLSTAFKEAERTGPCTVYLIGHGEPLRPPEIAGRAVATQATAPGHPVLVNAAPIDFLAAQTAAVADARGLPVLRDEASRSGISLAVDAEPDGGNAALVLRSDAPHLRFGVSLVNIDGARSGAPASEPVPMTPEARFPVTLKVPEAPFSFIPQSDRVPVPVKVRASLAALDADALAAAGIATPRRPVEAEGSVLVARHWGPSYLQTGAGVVALMASVTAAVAYGRKRQPIELGGTFTYKRHGGPRQLMETAGRSELVVGLSEDGHMRLGAADPVFVVRATRTLRGPVWEAEIRKHGIEVNGRAMRVGTFPVVPGATSFRFGDHRILWE